MEKKMKQNSAKQIFPYRVELKRVCNRSVLLAVWCEGGICEELFATKKVANRLLDSTKNSLSNEIFFVVEREYGCSTNKWLAVPSIF